MNGTFRFSPVDLPVSATETGYGDTATLVVGSIAAIRAFSTLQREEAAIRCTVFSTRHFVG